MKKTAKPEKVLTFNSLHQQYIYLGLPVESIKSLLQNSSISIKEIAYQLGFPESTHFSNYFKKYTNTSPFCIGNKQPPPNLRISY